MKLSLTVGIAACAAAALVVAVVASGGTATKNQRATSFSASLTAKAEVPRPRVGNRRPTGTFTGQLALRGDREVLEWKLTYRRLTGKATGAHIHYGRPGKVGRIAMSLCSRCGRGSVTGFTLTSSRRALTAIRAGNAYVNVHTRRNPKGEIRGRIRVSR